MEINPQQAITPEYAAPQYTPCGPYPGMLDVYNPRQAVWNGSSFWLDPFQQLFQFQQSGGYSPLFPDRYYNIETIAGGEYFSITKLGGIDSITGGIIEPEEMGNTLLNVMGADLIGSGGWEFSGCGTYQKENFPAYQCHFSKDAPQGTEVIVKITDISQGGPPTYFHTFIQIPLMIVDEVETIYIQHYYINDIDILVYDPGNCSLGCGGHLPSWVTFTVEIVQGQEYGSIHNLLTNESSDYFTNIVTRDTWAGLSEISWFEFVADGVQPDTSSPAHVIIRYTPSDASVGIVEYNIYVEYNDVIPVEEGILVQFADSVIAPGDTTEIILKRQNSDGTIEDFSQWNSFEIGMIDGCEAGQILVGTTLDVYFEEVYQPIYFVADSNLMNTDTVKVRVGLIEGISTRPVKTGEGEKESKAIDEKRNITSKKLTKSKKEPEPLPMKPTTFCFIGEIDWTYMGDGAVVVGDECDFDNCGDSYDDIIIEVKRQYNFYESGYFVVDSLGNTVVETKIDTVCFQKDSLNNVIPDSVMGQSRPLDYHRERKNQNGIYENAWLLKPCKNSSGKIELRPVLGDSITATPIYIDFIADVCYTNITNDGLKLISDTTQLSNTTLVPDTAKIAKDICGHNCYPQVVSQNGFIIKEIVESHELLHMEHFKRILADTKKDSLVNELKRWLTYTCYNYGENKRLNNLDGSFDSELRSYFGKAIRKYWVDYGHTRDVQGNLQIDKNIERQQERKIHYVPAIYDIVDKYQSALHNARGTAYPYTTCAKCP